jgi:hypothetical protein
MGNYVLTLHHERCPDGAEFAPHPRVKGAIYRRPWNKLKKKKPRHVLPDLNPWPVIRFRSERREDYRLRLETPDKLMVTEFLNTPPWVEDDSEEFRNKAGEWVADYSLMLKFISDYGFPLQLLDTSQMKHALKEKPELMSKLKLKGISEPDAKGQREVYLEPPRDLVKRKNEISLGMLIEMRQSLDVIWEAYERGNVDEAVELFRQHPVQGPLTGVSPDIEFRDGKPTLMFPVNSPYGFMLMETALVITGGSQVMRCSQCGTILVTGSGTGRRGTSRYCSNRCRVAAQRSRKVEDVMTDEEKLQSIAAAVRGTIGE